MGSLFKVGQSYFDKLYVTRDVSTVNGEKRAKVLLLDKFTTPIVSMAYTQSQLLEQDIILIELINNQHKFHNMKHMRCIFFVKPTIESIEDIIRELKNPHFSSYKIYLNNTISKSQLESIAEADEFELVSNIAEIFQDYWTVNDNLFKITLQNDFPNQEIKESNSLASLLLSLKRCPIIKYEPTSLELKKLSSELLYYINLNSNNNLFDDVNKHLETPPILLLLDRNNDPITPLISPWTYQSMVHEFIGISKNLVTIEATKEQLPLSEDQDKFFKDSMYLNYGDLTDKFQAYVEDYKKQTKQTSLNDPKTQNFADLKQMLSNFPEYRKLSGNILKHLNIISEIDRQIAAQFLWEVGELQQSLSSNLENQQSLKGRMIELLLNSHITTDNKIKLILLYLVRFPDSLELGQFSKILNDATLTFPPTLSQSNLINKFPKLFRTISVATTPPPSNNFSNILGQRIKINQFFSGDRGSDHAVNDNVYMQYNPRLDEVLSHLLDPEISVKKPSNVSLSTLVPDNIRAQYGPRAEFGPVQDLIIYIKGGVTYEEARLVHNLAERNQNLNITIGGDTVLNSKQWLSKLYDIALDS